MSISSDFLVTYWSWSCRKLPCKNTDFKRKKWQHNTDV